jgi:hypothetical protein
MTNVLLHRPVSWVPPMISLEGQTEPLMHHIHIFYTILYIYSIYIYIYIYTYVNLKCLLVPVYQHQKCAQEKAS